MLYISEALIELNWSADLAFWIFPGSGMKGSVGGEHHLHIYIKDTFNRRGQIWSSQELIYLGLCSFRLQTHHFQLQLLMQGGVELLLLLAVHLHDLHNNPVLVILQPPHHHCSIAHGGAHVLSHYFRYR